MSKIPIPVGMPIELPISGEKGAERLGRLRERADFLRKRIDSSTLYRGFDMAELSALEWAIGSILLYGAYLTDPPIGEIS